jgi:hypothetical protein
MNDSNGGVTADEDISTFRDIQIKTQSGTKAVNMLNVIGKNIHSTSKSDIIHKTDCESRLHAKMKAMVV